MVRNRHGMASLIVLAGCAYALAAAAFPVLFYLAVFRYLLLPVQERIGFIYLGVTSILTAVIVALLVSIFLPEKDKGKFRYCIWSRWFGNR